MILTVEKKYLTIIFFYLSIISVSVHSFEPNNPQGWTPETGLVQYGENIDRNRLELMEDKQLIHFPKNYKKMVTGTYTIRNSGDEYKTTLGIFFQELQGIPSPERLDLQFFVNNNKVNYYIINNGASITMGEKKIEIPQTSTCWALIDVTFPKNSIVTVKVQHKEIYSSYNHPELEYFPDLLYWKGPVKFSIEIINEYISKDNKGNVEYYWISNIIFTLMTKTDRGYWQFLHTNEYLQTLQNMETSFIKVHRKNGNTFLLEFNEDFNKEYYRSFMLGTRDWHSGIANAYVFIGENKINGKFDEVQLKFLKESNNISKRLLGPYELIFLTKKQLRVMRNAFYARHGYIFKTEDMQAMFTRVTVNNDKNPNFTESMLTETDRGNIEIIKRLEALTERRLTE